MVETAVVATVFVKLVIDIVRIGSPMQLPTWVSPVLALVLGQVFVFLITVSGGEVIQASVISDMILAGVLAAGSAVGVTDLSRRAV
jgi:hypothetical protein